MWRERGKWPILLEGFLFGL
nr:photosystem II protein J [Helleborus thibetanus]